MCRLQIDFDLTLHAINISTMFGAQRTGAASGDALIDRLLRACARTRCRPRLAADIGAALVPYLAVDVACEALAAMLPTPTSTPPTTPERPLVVHVTGDVSLGALTYEQLFDALGDACELVEWTTWLRVVGRDVESPLVRDANRAR